MPLEFTQDCRFRKTIARVVENLERAGIHPETVFGTDISATEETDLLQRVKAGASAILAK